VKNKKIRRIIGNGASFTKAKDGKAYVKRRISAGQDKENKIRK
jgi:hypothetical protein